MDTTSWNFDRLRRAEVERAVSMAPEHGHRSRGDCAEHDVERAVTIEVNQRKLARCLERSWNVADFMRASQFPLPHVTSGRFAALGDHDATLRADLHRDHDLLFEIAIQIAGGDQR